MLKRIISIFLLLISSGCTSYIYNNDTSENKIIIESININNSINISSIKDEVNGIVLFSEYGRPNIKNTNTIVGAHSGYGPNAYFNFLETLELGSYIKLIYENIPYLYEVTNVYEVVNTNTDVLKDNSYSMLTLITCKINDTNKKVIVIAKML